MTVDMNEIHFLTLTDDQELPASMKELGERISHSRFLNSGDLLFIYHLIELTTEENYVVFMIKFGHLIEIIDTGKLTRIENFGEYSTSYNADMDEDDCNYND